MFIVCCFPWHFCGFAFFGFLFFLPFLWFLLDVDVDVDVVDDGTCLWVVSLGF